MHRGSDGLERLVAIPDRVLDRDAEWGALIGPPDVVTLGEELGWPPELARRLHEQLVARRLLIAADVRRAGGAPAVRAALIHALRADVRAVLALYAEQ